MAEINEQYVRFPYDAETLPEGVLAVPSCNPGMVVIKLQSKYYDNPISSLLIVNIETGIPHVAEECTFRTLGPGATITLEVKEK